VPETFNLEIYRLSSSGGSSSNDNDDEGETIVLKKVGECLDDGNNDKYGFSITIYKTMNKLTNEILSLSSEKKVCLLAQEEIQEDNINESKIYDANFTAIFLIAFGIVILGLVIILFLYKQLL